MPTSKKVKSYKRIGCYFGTSICYRSTILSRLSDIGFHMSVNIGSKLFKKIPGRILSPYEIVEVINQCVHVLSNLEDLKLLYRCPHAESTLVGIATHSNTVRFFMRQIIDHD